MKFYRNPATSTCLLFVRLLSSRTCGVSSGSCGSVACKVMSASRPFTEHVCNPDLELLRIPRCVCGAGGGLLNDGPMTMAEGQSPWSFHASSGSFFQLEVMDISKTPGVPSALLRHHSADACGRICPSNTAGGDTGLGRGSSPAASGSTHPFYPQAQRDRLHLCPPRLCLRQGTLNTLQPTNPIPSCLRRVAGSGKCSLQLYSKQPGAGNRRPSPGDGEANTSFLLPRGQTQNSGQSGRAGREGPH